MLPLRSCCQLSLHSLAMQDPCASTAALVLISQSGAGATCRRILVRLLPPCFSPSAIAALLGRVRSFPYPAMSVSVPRMFQRGPAFASCVLFLQACHEAQAGRSCEPGTEPQAWNRGGREGERQVLFSRPRGRQAGQSRRLRSFSPPADACSRQIRCLLRCGSGVLTRCAFASAQYFSRPKD